MVKKSKKRELVEEIITHQNAKFTVEKKLTYFVKDNF